MKLVEKEWYEIHIVTNENKAYRACVSVDNLENIKRLFKKQEYIISEIIPKTEQFIEPTDVDLASLTVEQL